MGDENGRASGHGSKTSTARSVRERPAEWCRLVERLRVTSRTLRVNAPMSFGLLHLTLGGFAQAFPEVEVDLVLDDRVLDLGDQS